MPNTTHNPINQLREDAIFAEKVKRVLIDHEGVMALLTLLQEFKQLRSSKSKEETNKYQEQTEEESSGSSNKNDELSYEEKLESSYLQSSDRHQEEWNEIKDKVTDHEFIALLRHHGLELTHFEERYLCNAFKKCNYANTRQCDLRKNIKKKVPHYICSKTFIRHLTNVNPRRKDVLERAWCFFVETFTKLNSNTVNVSDECTNASCATAAVDKCTIRCVDNCESETAAHTLPAAHNTFVQTITPYLSCSKKQEDVNILCEDESAANKYNSGSTAVLDRDEFDAIWAGVSICVTDDNVFEQLVQSTFDMNHEHLTSNANSLVVGKNGNIYCTNDAADNCGQTYYVKDALDSSLGVSTRSYNYTHMLRKFPFIPLLPPLDRKQIMQTTVQRVYTPFTSEVDVKLADPLYFRRGQVM